MTEVLWRRLLLNAERPARYVGGELNAAPPSSPGSARMALVFPDTYEIGMSHVGMRILYHLVNDQPGLACERAFHPWTDMEAALRAGSVELRTLESGTPLREFPLVGFSLPYELLYANVLNILDLARIPLLAAERGESDPIVVAGGPACFNPEPMAPYFDVAVLGDGEEVVAELCRLASDRSQARGARLSSMASLPGCYRPSDLDVTFDERGRLSSSQLRGRPPGARIAKALVRDLDHAYFPQHPLVPSTEIVHDRANLEIHRGCVHGCRFCQAGYLYRPLRVRSKERLVGMADEILASTGYEELGLVSLNSVDHPDILEVVTALGKELDPRRVAIGLPSLRMDELSLELAQRLSGVKKTQMTLAPEAGSQRLRDVINKNLTEEQILGCIGALAEAGWSDLKLYFMVGLPTETDADVEAIGTLVRAILNRGRERSRARNFSVTVHVSSFVAKAHTPFQWEAQADVATLRRRMQLLTGAMRDRRVHVKWRDLETGLVEGLLARGDRRLAPVIRRVWQAGGALESWSDNFRYARWERAMADEGLSLDDFVCRERDDDELLPWDFIDAGVTREFLLLERRRAREGVTTPDCVRGPCAGCGFGPGCPTHGLRRERAK